MPFEDTEHALGSIQDLANLLVLGQGSTSAQPHGNGGPSGRTDNNRCGRAVFLVGAGCSVSAGIPLGADVARRCATYLARIYAAHDGVESGLPDVSSGRDGDETIAATALNWLRRNRGVPTFDIETHPDWGRYYKYFFDVHFASINQQRAFIDSIVDLGGDRLNWEHACLAELVARRYVHTVLTTNFDQLVLQGVIRTGQLPVVADGIEAVNRVTAEPRRPQIVHLHGSMHTYNLRNSQIAVSETDQDPTLRSMLYTILHRCDLLVVVGYAGGEEGVMRVLIDAARQLPPLVVYWVMPEHDGELSLLGKELMGIGENKFLLKGTSALMLFQGLMNRLKVGEPAWMTDPVQTLRRYLDHLVPASTVDVEIARSIERFSARVERAENSHRANPSSPRDVAAELRLCGRYQKSLDVLDKEGDRVTSDLGLLTLRAANRFSIAEEDDAEIDLLDKAAEDLGSLVSRSTGSSRAQWAIQLFRALMLLYERTKDNGLEAASKIRRILEAVPRPEELAAESADKSTGIDVHMLLGQAYQIMADEEDKLQDAMTAAGYFEKASEELEGSTDRRWADVQAGLATTLQVIASKEKDEKKAGRAVSILHALVASASGSREEHAGRLMNLAGALVAQANLTDPPGRSELRMARDYFGQAIAIYRASGSDSLDDLRLAISERLTVLRRLEI